MIHLNRDAIEKPAAFGSDTMRTEQKRLATFYERSQEERAQRKYKPNYTLLRECEEAVHGLSSGKCAYCETPTTPGSSRSTDSYRPKVGALGLDGKVSTDHYWWLTYEWTNVLP